MNPRVAALRTFAPFHWIDLKSRDSHGARHEHSDVPYAPAVMRVLQESAASASGPRSEAPSNKLVSREGSIAPFVFDAEKGAVLVPTPAFYTVTSASDLDGQFKAARND